MEVEEGGETGCVEHVMLQQKSGAKQSSPHHVASLD